MKLKDILEKKGGGKVFSIGPADILIDACEALSKHNIGLLVVIEDEKVKGVLSERDLVRKGILREVEMSITPVASLMTTGVVSSTPDEDLVEALKKFKKHRFRHLPIVEDDKCVGVITERDIIEVLLDRMNVAE